MLGDGNATHESGQLSTMLVGLGGPGNLDLGSRPLMRLSFPRVNSEHLFRFFLTGSVWQDYILAGFAHLAVTVSCLIQVGCEWGWVPTTVVCVSGSGGFESELVLVSVDCG